MRGRSNNIFAIGVLGFWSFILFGYAAPQILDDPAQLSSDSWAAFHPSDNGLYQQMTLRATAGSLFHIESSDDLETWTVEVTRYGFYNGQVLKTFLFERSQAAAPAPTGGGAPLNSTPRRSVTTMLRAVPGGGVLVSWPSLDSSDPIQYHLPGKSLAPGWSVVPISGASDDNYSLNAMNLGPYTGILNPNPTLGSADATFMSHSTPCSTA